MPKIAKNVRALMSTAQNIIKEVQMNCVTNFFRREDASITLPTLRQKARDVVVKNRVYTFTDMDNR